MKNSFVLTAIMIALTVTSASSIIPLAQSQSVTGDANVFVELSRRLVPSVVNISTLTTVQSPFLQGDSNDLFRRFFEDFFGPGYRGGPFESEPPGRGQNQQKRRPAPQAMALGTGFIIDASGLILTNNHVVENADEIKVSFTEDPTEKPVDGKVVGRDPELDVALIQVKTGRKLSAMTLGDSDALQVGEYAAAIGNPFGQGHSVTHGIVSAKGRISPDMPLLTYIQTDAPINPGNSGGPLVNLKGEVIGINNAILASAQGIGFAIPVNLVKQVLPQLKTKGTVERGYLGILIGPLTPEIAEKIDVSKELTAPFVTHVTPQSPAAKAGLQPYDVILEFNGKPVRTPGELTLAVTSVKVGSTIPVRINRGGKERELKVTVGKRPPSGPESTPKQPKEELEPAHIDTGLRLENLTPELSRQLDLPQGLKGVAVSEVRPGSPAVRAGISRGDIILEVDKKKVGSVQDFFSLVKEEKNYLLRIRKPSPEGRDAFIVAILDLRK